MKIPFLKSKPKNPDPVSKFVQNYSAANDHANGHSYIKTHKSSGRYYTYEYGHVTQPSRQHQSHRGDGYGDIRYQTSGKSSGSLGITGKTNQAFYNSSNGRSRGGDSNAKEIPKRTFFHKREKVKRGQLSYDDCLGSAW
ncbi:hypothetical protein PNOK_0790200 [Pyrrhoderma noxium]|uniref:Uncharacterized protein n=1 Tax=Pyrrhoderma noxium TaxID=2282107 RepID=A0A286U9L3_9AGAM|nr:hypothetical protein PNOK_0790200 [Pyrrhoderma noxium]